jgi:hypothetical protein
MEFSQNWLWTCGLLRLTSAPNELVVVYSGRLGDILGMSVFH